MASQRSLRGLDWFAFFVADIQTGWGPFVATYLTSVAWTQFDIGLILTIGTITGLALQIPAGALVDGVPSKRLLAALAVASISASALLLALCPTFNSVVAAKILHAIASSLLGPTLVAMSLGLVGHALFSNRLGRNVRFLSLGNAIAAGVAGGIAYYYSNQGIFFLTATLGVPTLIALAQISPSEIDSELARGGISKSAVSTWFDTISVVVHNRLLLGFAAAIMLFQLAKLRCCQSWPGYWQSGPRKRPPWCYQYVFSCRNSWLWASHLGSERRRKVGAVARFYCLPLSRFRSAVNIRGDERPLLARCGATP